jgi:ParB family chromosome partitioning protein
MKIDIDKIEIGDYDVREEKPEEHIEDLKNSLETEGQLNPIIVTARNGDYVVVSGHSRLRAARELGWDEIEANVRDLSEEEADKLSLTSNMFRKEMSNLEQGKVLNKLMNEHDWTKKEVADKIGKSTGWVNRRVKVALDVDEEVAEALENDEINIEAAYHIASLDKKNQTKLLNRILEKGITQAPEIRREKRWLENDTIYTIGYSGKDFDQFLQELKENDIDLLIDTRKSNNSQYKPEFNGKVLKRQLEQEGIDYVHREDLGVPYLMQTPYKEGIVGDESFGNWYKWYVKEENEIDIEELVEDIKKQGNTAILCMEQYAQPKADQTHYCHRHFLAEMLSEAGFGERKDI